MSQAETLTLIAELQRAKRRWKTLALSLLVVLIVLFFAAVLLAIYGLSRAKAAQMRASKRCGLPSRCGTRRSRPNRRLPST